MAGKAMMRQWTCLRCLRRRQLLQPSYRSLSLASATASASTATATASATTFTPFYPDTSVLKAPSLARDDDTLRRVFDSKPFWEDFSQNGRVTTTARRSAGLFRNHHLTSPEGFEHFAHATLERCRGLVAKVLGISTVEGYKGIVKDMDRLSDLLCRVIDLADFVRATHPDRAFQAAAGAAHALMFEYMNTLNTTTGLNEQLKRALANPKVTAAWSEEEMKVALILRKDFAQSAIDLPAAKRQRFVELSNTISVLGSRFVDEMQPARPYLWIDGARLKGVSPMVLRGLMDRRGRAVLSTMSGAADLVLRCAEDEEIRREVYIASRTASDGQVQILEELLAARAELAQLSGFDSYARMALTDKMAGTPEAAVTFLEALAADNGPRMREEMTRMLELKRREGRSSTPDQIHAWDRKYYRAQLAEVSRKAKRSARRAVSSITEDDRSAYFSLGTVMQGLSRLFTRLYGVRFVPAEPQPGETWTPEVRRLDVVDESEGLIAVIYCDLFARAGKSPNPAHFTLRCSRRIPAAEIAEAASSASTTAPLSPTLLSNDGMATAPHADGTASQLPTIALICDFPQPASPSQPPLLPLTHLTTLFHEMGHAVHSVLGRTALQNVAGTRCATDFAELPSVLAERFATHPDVLRLYARHWRTDEPLHLPQDHNLFGDTALDAVEDAADTEAQVRMALLDQAFHARPPFSPEWTTDAALRAIDDRYALIPEPHEARWQGFFGHLVGYGASYYSYLFDRAIAGRVWSRVFEEEGGEGPVSRRAGERFRSEVLKWGGARDGWACVAGVLGGEEGERVAGGGKRAMAEVGRWGVDDTGTRRKA